MKFFWICQKNNNTPEKVEDVDSIPKNTNVSKNVEIVVKNLGQSK